MHPDIAVKIDHDCQQLPDSFICPDIDWCGLEIHGHDAEDFLQGQLSADIKEANCVLAGLCDLKGRLIATGYCLRISEREFIYCVHASLAEIIRQHWKLYAQFSKVNIQLSDKLVCMQRTIKNNSLNYTRPDYAPQEIALYNEAELIQYLQDKQTTIVNANCWLINEINNKLAHITAATTSKFLPQMLAFEQRGGVSFTKGCYLGQEVIARAQHLGKIKRHLQTINLNMEAQNLAGHELTTAAGKAAGLIVNSASIDINTIALAVVHEQHKNEELNANTAS